MRADRIAAVAGIVLAAGASMRMGGNKLFFEIDGETLLRRAARAALAAGLDPVIVVLGHEADRALEALADLRCQPVLNFNYVRGVNESLRTGIGCVPAEAAAACVMLADMPFVASAMLATLIERFRASDAPLVVSRYGDVNAPPILYARSLFEELLSTEGEACGKQVVRRHRGEALTVSWPEEALTDVDVPEDYERLKARSAARAIGSAGRPGEGAPSEDVKMQMKNALPRRFAIIDH